MQGKTRELYEAALQLPEEERETLVALLELTIVSDSADDETVAFRAELDRRYQRIMSGEAKGVPWEVVQERARQIANESPER